MKRLFFDLEVAPNLAMVWRTGFKKTVTPESIVEERKIISVAWKWGDKSTIHALTWDKNRDDKKLLRDFVPVLEESDEAVAYFGDGFDFPWVKARCLVHRVRLSPEIKIVDPIKWVAKLNLNSNKLNYVAKLLGLEQKLPVDLELWKEVVLNNSPSALARMVRYNKRDITVLENVYNEVSQYFPAKTHAGVLSGGTKWSCPKCSSEDVRTTKTRVTAKGATQYQMQCKSGHFFSIGEAAHKSYQSI